MVTDLRECAVRGELLEHTVLRRGEIDEQGTARLRTALGDPFGPLVQHHGVRLRRKLVLRCAEQSERCCGFAPDERSVGEYQVVMDMGPGNHGVHRAQEMLDVFRRLS